MRRVALVGLVILALAAGTAAVASTTGGYRVSVVLPSATNLNEGSPILVDGLRAGQVAEIAVEDGRARLTLDIDDAAAPLHDGALATVKWRGLVSERWIELYDGADGNAEIPSGGMLRGAMPAPMEVDQVLAALDEPTRKKVKSLVAKLNTTVGGREQDVRKTLSSAGPALSALGEVLRGVGSDGAAIRQLVAQLDDVVGSAAARDKQVSQVVTKLSQLASAVAGERTALSGTLAKLPATVDRAEKVLRKVPAVTEDAAPLLADLKPATDSLRPVARNLAPLLRDLRPLTARLRPTLADADELLKRTPGLLGTAHEVVPGVNTTIAGLREPLDFLRPYTPEAAGFLANWASALGNYSGSGHYARFHVSVGAHSPGANPGVVPPGYEQAKRPAPGASVGQPWTDAYGGGVR